MRVTTLHGTRDIRLQNQPEPTLVEPTDAIVRVVASCICGSDLWPYRGENPITPGDPIGHEVVGVVEDLGADVTGFTRGDFVIVPFCHCDNTCANCRYGAQSVCVNLGFTQGGQAEFVRVNQAAGSMVSTGDAPGEDLLAGILTLADVFPTGWHAAVCAGVRPGGTVAVVGDGAVGLCGVLSARQQGAERIIALSRHEARQAIARRFGATDVVVERGPEAAAKVLDLTEGVGVDAVLECVGTNDSMQTALRLARPGGGVGFVGAPHGVESPVAKMFRSNVGLRGGMAPVRRYLPELLDLVTSGSVDPAPVFDLTLPLEQVADGYRAMDERTATKVMLRP